MQIHIYTKVNVAPNILLKGQWLKNSLSTIGFWNYESDQVKIQKLHITNKKEKPVEVD